MMRYGFLYRSLSSLYDFDYPGDFPIEFIFEFCLLVDLVRDLDILVEFCRIGLVLFLVFHFEF